jgi:hypothetical protein
LGNKLKERKMIYIVGIVCFIAGFLLAALAKDNITIGFGNQTITMIDGEIVENKNKKKEK